MLCYAISRWRLSSKQGLVSFLSSEHQAHHICYCRPRLGYRWATMRTTRSLPYYRRRESRSLPCPSTEKCRASNWKFQFCRWQEKCVQGLCFYPFPPTDYPIVFPTGCNSSCIWIRFVTHLDQIRHASHFLSTSGQVKISGQKVINQTRILERYNVYSSLFFHMFFFFWFLILYFQVVEYNSPFRVFLC